MLGASRVEMRDKAVMSPNLNTQHLFSSTSPIFLSADGKSLRLKPEVSCCWVKQKARPFPIEPLLLVALLILLSALSNRCESRRSRQFNAVFIGVNQSSDRGEEKCLYAAVVVVIQRVNEAFALQRVLNAVNNGAAGFWR